MTALSTVAAALGLSVDEAIDNSYTMSPAEQAAARSLPVPPLPAGAADPSVSHDPGSAAVSPTGTTTSPALVPEGPAAPTSAGEIRPGARRDVSAERGRPSPAGPGPRGGGPGQLPHHVATALDLLRRWAAAPDDRRPDEPLVDFYGRRLGTVEALVGILLEHLDTEAGGTC